MPIAEALHKMSAKVTSIIEFRNKELVISEDKLRAAADKLVMTNNGSYCGGRERCGVALRDA